MNKFLTIFLFLLSYSLHSQIISQFTISEYEDTLEILSKRIINGESQEIRNNYNIGFMNEIKEVLKYKNSFNYPFSKLKSISILKPDDNKFRLFSWILPLENGNNKYYALLLFEGKETNKIVELKQILEPVNDLENTVFYHNNWHGALYYKIISNNKRNNQFYTLLAWNGFNSFLRKTIDILEINKDSIIFGKDVFIRGNKKTKRVIIDYNKNSSLSLKYEEKENRIIFNHLIHIEENYNEKPLDMISSYEKDKIDNKELTDSNIPDESYDCFKFKNGKWIFIENIDVRSDIKLKRIKRSRIKQELFKD